MKKENQYFIIAVIGLILGYIALFTNHIIFAGLYALLYTIAIYLMIGCKPLKKNSSENHGKEKQ